MKVLKFGGSSLANGKGIENCLKIISKAAKEPIVVVVSARGNSTDELEQMLEDATRGNPYTQNLVRFFQYQEGVDKALVYTEERKTLEELLGAVNLIGEYSEGLKDKILAFGEVIAAKTIVHLLKKQGLKSALYDSRELIKTKTASLEVEIELSEKLVRNFYQSVAKDELPVITGFIASDMKGNTTTLGRNGSNYTASLIARFLKAEELQNWTNIDGIYTANPQYVKHAKHIAALTYREANELANFGANILHAKTILPLIDRNIPVKILNTFRPELPGTTINEKGAGKGVKAVSIINDVSLVSIEGRGLMGKVGIDARIFNSLSLNNISVRMISQASSERGIGFIVNQPDAKLAQSTLEKEFRHELQNKDLSKIEVNSNLAIIAIIGRHNFALEKAISGLRKNRIWMYLINNSINGEHISLVVANDDLKKAANVVHNQVFGAIKTLHIVAFGKGTVGSAFIDQVIGTGSEIISKRNLKLSVVGIVDSKRFLFNPDGIDTNWREKLSKATKPSNIMEIQEAIQSSGLENIVVVDNTASRVITEQYPEFVKSGFDLIASNKMANSMSYGFYQNLRSLLKQTGRTFLYETNVGAGLPLIDTLRLLHLSGEHIRKIKGVFSGSLSYLFNNFSLREKPFSEILLYAKTSGLTEPDPREDLSGNDVARKLLILAREIGIQAEIEDVEVQNLIPSKLKSIEKWNDFEKHFNKLDQYYAEQLETLPKDKVFRYVGQLETGKGLSVSLVEAGRSSPLGNISGSDSIFEIYTEAYGDQPIVIQGAGAGAEVTARGVYSDLLRIGSKL